MVLFVDIMRLQAAPPEEGKDACIRKPLYDSLALGLPPVEAQDVDLFNCFHGTPRAVSRRRCEMLPSMTTSSGAPMAPMAPSFCILLLHIIY